MALFQIDVHVHNVAPKDIQKILDSLLLLTTNQTKIMGTLADIQAKTAALQAEVAAEDTVIDSAVALISGFATTLSDIKQQLADAIAANDPTAIQAVADALDATAADVSAKKQQLADAVVAGTPAA